MKYVVLTIAIAVFSVSAFSQKKEALRKPSQIVQLSAYELFMKGIGLRYEFVTKSEKLGVGASFSYAPGDDLIEFGGYLRPYFYKGKESKYTLGSTPLGMATFNFFIGPEFYVQKNFLADKDNKFTRALITPGFRFQFRKGFCIIVDLGVGARSYSVKDNVEKSFGESVYIDYRADVCLGMRF